MQKINSDSISLLADSQQSLLHWHWKFSAAFEEDIPWFSLVHPGSCCRNAVSQKVPWKALPTEHNLFIGDDCGNNNTRKTHLELKYASDAWTLHQIIFFLQVPKIRKKKGSWDWTAEFLKRFLSSQGWCPLSSRILLLSCFILDFQCCNTFIHLFVYFCPKHIKLTVTQLNWRLYIDPWVDRCMAAPHMSLHNICSQSMWSPQLQLSHWHRIIQIKSVQL